MAGVMNSLRNNIFGYGGAAVTALSTLSPTPVRSEPKPLPPSTLSTTEAVKIANAKINLSKPNSDNLRPVDAIIFEDGVYDPLQGMLKEGKPLSIEALAKKAAVVGADTSHMKESLRRYNDPSDRESYVEDTLLLVKRGILTETQASTLFDSDIGKAATLVDAIKVKYRKELTDLKRLKGLAPNQTLPIKDRNIAIEKTKEYAEGLLNGSTVASTK